MHRILLSCVMTVVFFSAATAQVACDRADAENRWLRAEQAQIVRGYGFQDGELTIVVDRQTWDTMELSVRVGIVETLECAALGPGQMFGTFVNYIDQFGVPLARFDGRRRRMEVLR